MKTIMFALLVSAVALLAACGPGATSLQVKVDGKDSTLAVKTTGTYTSTKTFTMSKEGQTTITKAASHYIAFANYDLDTSSGMVSLDKPVTAADQIRVTIQLIGEEGTDDKAALKPGTYTAKADKYSKVDSVAIAVFADGKEKKTYFGSGTAEGQVKVSAVSGDTISGEIDLKDGERIIKGPFTAKITAKR